MWLVLLIVFSAIAETPKCLSQVKKSTLTQIEDEMIPDKEILTRLIFAEGISTNYASHNDCKEKGSEIFEAIGWGVMARVRMGEFDNSWANKYGKTIKEVIFKQGQFNPAISKKSRFANYFKCPQKAPEWKKHWSWASSAARTVIDNQHESPFIKSKWEKKFVIPLVSHFYYPLSTQATKVPPKWADRKKHSRQFVSELKIRNKYIPETCIWFFRHERPIRKDDS